MTPLIRSFPRLPRLNKLAGPIASRAVSSSAKVSGGAEDDKEGEFHERKIQAGVSDIQINFATVGTGPHPVLCLPGIFGTIETDFGPVLRRMDPGKFTLICWDPPGYGKSRPPARDPVYKGNPFANDADAAAELMRLLDIPKYSVLGWGNGGTTGAHLASLYRKSVDKLVCWSSPAKLDGGSLDRIALMTDPRNWVPERWQSMLEIYGESTAQQLIAQYRAYVEKCVRTRSFRLELLLPTVRVPTLILHGSRDSQCSLEEAQTYRKFMLKSTLEVWADADEHLHLDHVDKFTERVEQFLLNGQ